MKNVIFTVWLAVVFAAAMFVFLTSAHGAEWVRVSSHRGLTVSYLSGTVRPLLPGWMSVVVGIWDQDKQTARVCLFNLSHNAARMVECFDGHSAVRSDEVLPIAKGSALEKVARVVFAPGGVR
jgi:hypothetical protein